MTTKQTIKTYEQIAPLYARHTQDRAPLTADYDRFLALLDATHGQNILRYPLLDVGCGPGYDVRHFNRAGWPAIGIDLSFNMMHAGRQATPQLPQQDFAQADMGQLPIASSRIAGIWLCASLLHIPRHHVPMVLEELRRVLIAQGVLYVAVKEGTGEVWVEMSHGEPSPRFFVYWQQATLDQLLQQMGFDIVRRWKNPSRSGGQPWLVRLTTKRIDK